MEIEFNINLHFENLATELFEWYGLQGFEVLNRIFNEKLYEYEGEELEQKLDELRDVWNELPIEERIEFYNQYENFK